MPHRPAHRPNCDGPRPLNDGSGPVDRGRTVADTPVCHHGIHRSAPVTSVNRDANFGENLLVEAKGLEPSNLLTASQALYQLSYAPESSPG